METYKVVSERGKKVLIVESAKFTKDKVLKSGEIYWRCAIRSCKAKVFTMGAEDLISRCDLQHDHPKDIKKLNRQIISNSVKRKATEELSERPSKIIHSVLKKHSEQISTLSVRDMYYIRNNLYNNRRKHQPPLPKTTEDVIDTLKKVNVQTIREEDFIFISDQHTKIVVFSCWTNIRYLCSSEKIFLDGTFSYCAQYFLQLFTIHILQNGHYIPLAFCLLPDKLQTTYECLFNLIKTKCESGNLHLNPKTVVADFEKAIHNAVRAVWQDSQLIGCRFHLGQAWFRKIQKLGLTAEYKKQESEIGRWLKYTFGLPFLNSADVGECFAFDFAEIQPQDERISKYADYLVDNYIGEEATFPPELWAECSDSIERTTNACESFHSRFNSNFYSTHPNIFAFVEVLKQFQTETYVKLQSLTEEVRIRDPAVRKRTELLHININRYNLGEISRLHFVQCAAYMYSSVNN